MFGWLAGLELVPYMDNNVDAMIAGDCICRSSFLHGWLCLVGPTRSSECSWQPWEQMGHARPRRTALPLFRFQRLGPSWLVLQSPGNAHHPTSATVCCPNGLQMLVTFLVAGTLKDGMSIG